MRLELTAAGSNNFVAININGSKLFPILPASKRPSKRIIEYRLEQFLMRELRFLLTHASYTNTMFHYCSSVATSFCVEICGTTADYLTASPLIICKCIASLLRHSFTKNAPMAVVCLDGLLPASLM